MRRLRAELAASGRPVAPRASRAQLAAPSGPTATHGATTATSGTVCRRTKRDQLCEVARQRQVRQGQYPGAVRGDVRGVLAAPVGRGEEAALFHAARAASLSAKAL